MVWAPLSEVPQIGRMPVYIFTLAMFVVLQVPTALATNYGMLMAFRFLTGFFGSPILATGGATIADIYAPKKRAYGMTLWGLFATCAPSLGPLVGGFAAHVEGWRWTIWEIMWLSGATLVLLFFFFPETSASNILYRRAKRLRKMTGNPSIKSASEIAAAAMRPRDWPWRSLFAHSPSTSKSRSSSSSTSTLVSYTPFFTSGSSPSRSFSSASTIGVSRCSAYPSLAFSLAPSSSYPRSSRTYISCRSPNTTTRVNSNLKSGCPSRSLARSSSPSVCFGLDGHRAQMSTGLSQSSAPACLVSRHYFFS
jgi:multidrug resistance protein